MIDSFPSNVASDLTRPYILSRSMQLAQLRRDEELKKAEREIISQYANEIRAYNKL